MVQIKGGGTKERKWYKVREEEQRKGNGTKYKGRGTKERKWYKVREEEQRKGSKKESGGVEMEKGEEGRKKRRKRPVFEIFEKILKL